MLFRGMKHYTRLASEAAEVVQHLHETEGDALIHDHGIALREDLEPEYDDLELEARRLTARQLREIADKLDPPVEDDDASGAMVHVRISDDHHTPAKVQNYTVQVPLVGDGVFNLPVFVHANGRRDFALNLSVSRRR